MLQNFNALLAPALMDRLVLLVNHVLASEPQAMARLVPHSGKLLQLVLPNWPRLLPAPPSLAFAVTPAGLVAWCADPGVADLQVSLDLGNPLALGQCVMSGEMPPVVIDGDAQLATDVDWLIKNLRWDVADDLDRLFGASVARALQRVGSALAAGLRAAVQGVSAAAGLARGR